MTNNWKTGANVEDLSVRKFFSAQVAAARGCILFVGVEFLFFCAPLFLIEPREHVNNLTSPVVATVRAGGMREHRLLAMRADGKPRARERVVGATLMRRGLRVAHADDHTLLP